MAESVPAMSGAENTELAANLRLSPRIEEISPARASGIPEAHPG